MLRKASEAVSEGNVPISQQEEHGSGQPTLAGVYRRIKLMMSHFEEQTELLENRLTRLEHGARQPRLAMEADGPSVTKTRERTEGAATAVQAMRGVVQRLGGGGDVTNLSPFWEGMARK